jgi:hypothetical protein
MLAGTVGLIGRRKVDCLRHRERKRAAGRQRLLRLKGRKEQRGRVVVFS